MSECATEDPILTVRFTWDDTGELELPPTRPDEGLAGLWWNSLTLPDWTMRYTQAPPSAYVPGNVLLAYVPDSSSLTLGVVALGSDTATLETQKAIVESALGAHWPFTVHIDVDGVAVYSWRSDPTTVRWGTMTPQRSGLFVAEGAVAIPVQPVGAP